MPLVRNLKTLISNPQMLFPLLAWESAKRLHHRPPIMTPHDGIRFGAFTSFSEFLLRHQGLDPEDRAVIRHCLTQRPDTTSTATALDVGGNMGLFSLTLAASGYQKIYAFEPIAFNADRFQSNLTLNPTLAPRITLTRAAISDRPGQLTMVLDRNSPGTCRILTPIELTANAPLPSHQQRVQAPVLTLDTFATDHALTDITFLKIDVEGFEPCVLKGAQRLLAAGAIHFIFMEVIFQAWQLTGHTPAQVYDLLADHHYLPTSPATLAAPFSTIPRATFIAQTPGGSRNILWSRHTSP